MSKQSAPKYSFLTTATAGSIAGGVECLINWPSEVIKTELQMQSKSNPVYKGYFDCMRGKVKSQGVISLYRGLVPVVLGSMPKAGVRFGGNSFFRTNVFSGADGKISSIGVLGAGLSAGATEAVLVVTPMETLKTRLINANKPFVSGTINLIQTEGIGAIYKGVVPTIMKQSLNQGTRFLVYDEVMTLIKSATGKEVAGPIEAISGGMIAGAASVMVNQPVDTIKTIMQSADAAKYKGTLDCFTSIIKNEGPFAVYKGLVPRLARVCPGSGIIFGTVNFVKPPIGEFFDGIPQKR